MAVRHAVPWLVVAATGGLVVALLVLPVEALFAYVPRNYNEGWNAFHALRLRTGGPLYPPLGEAIFINYPPLSFYVVAALHPLFGDDIFSGRAVALLAEIVVAVNMALAARALRVSWPLAAMTALVFLAFVGVFYEDAVAIDDPQWLGQAFQSTAIVLLLRRDRADWSTLVPAAVLCLLGGLTKQSLVVGPLAITIWLAIEDRRGLARWCLACGALVALALSTLTAVYGWGFVDQVLRSERGIWLAALLFVGNNLAIWLAPYGLSAIAGVVLGGTDRGVRLVATYLAVALLIGTALLAVDGVGYSALFDLTIAAMLGTALLLQWVSDHLAALPGIPAAVVLLPALPILVLGQNAFSAQSGLRSDLARSEAWRQVIDRIAGANGEVACEMLSLCYWAGRPSVVEFFNFGQYAGLHETFAAPVVARIQAGSLALIQEDGISGSRRLPAFVNAAIAERYMPSQIAPTTLLVPDKPDNVR